MSMKGCIKRWINTWRIVGLLVIGFALLACGSNASRQEIAFVGQTMGTSYRVKIVTEVEKSLESNEKEELAGEIERVLDTVNASMSTYLVDSELSQFNRLPANQPQLISPPLLEVVQISQEISKITGGAFDITVAPAVRAWGFGANAQKEDLPSPSEVKALKSFVGYKNLVLSGDTLMKKVAATEMDLSAVAKGFAIDQIARLLDTKRVTNYLIEIGGELKARGTNAQAEAWRVAIEKPEFNGGVFAVIELQDRAIATSGDYRNFVQLGGKTFSHTIDPVTARPVVHQLASATVLHESAARADALATAMMVMGLEHAVKFSKEYDISSFFITRPHNQEGYQVVKVGEFTQLLQ